VGRLGLWIVLTLVVSAASNVTEVNGSAEGNGTLRSLTVERNGSADDRTTARMAALRAELETLEQESGSEDIWSKIYSNYITYQNLQHRLDVLSKRYFKLNRLEKPTPREREELRRIKMERATLRSKLDLLKEYADNPFRKLLAPPKLDEPPAVGSPVGIIGAISYRQKLANDRKAYAQTHQSLVQVLDHLRAKQSIMGRMLDLDPYNTRLQNELTEVNREIETLLPVEEILKTTEEVYSKKIEEARLKVDADIAREIRKAAVIAGVVLGFFILFLLAKYLIQRYMSKKESFYLINKALNFIFLNVVVLILLFAYIENVSYLVTILGFASAGIAIAMKDWFMSLLGWFVIVIGGSVHVGDRVKFVRDGVEYVGDIVDISPLRMTMQEDITLTTYMHNRRSGRMIFIPNNYIFTDMLANYSHAGLKTVWDGIDFTITYDSNAHKAITIAKEVVKKYSKGYTDITRKQLNKLRKSYHLKNTNVEPRVYSFIEPYGIKISAWYMTNAFATLTLRSTISLEILERLRAEEDITLAYPTQALYLNEHIPAPTSVPPGEPPAGEPAPSA
jgi:small-conductance mechanosensitive channel